MSGNVYTSTNELLFTQTTLFVSYTQLRSNASVGHSYDNDELVTLLLGNIVDLMGGFFPISIFDQGR